MNQSELSQRSFPGDPRGHRAVFAVIGIIMGAAVASVGCDGGAGGPPPRPPQLHVAEPEQDLGEIPVAPTGRDVVFEVHNRGFEDLIFSELIVSCRCASARAEPTTIPPDGAGRVIVTVAPKDVRPDSASVTLVTNDPLNPQFNVSVSWNAVAPLAFDPPSVDLGRLRPGGRAEQIVRILRRDDLEFASLCPIQEVKHGVNVPHDRMTTEYVPAGDSPDGEGEFIRVSLEAGEESQLGSAYVLVGATECWKEQFEIHVAWEVRPAVEVSPERLFLGVAAPGTTVSGRVRFTPEEGARVAISGARLDPELDGAEIVVDAGADDAPDAAEVTLTLLLPEEPGVVQSSLVVELAEPESGTIHVPFSAVVRRQ